MTSFIAWLSSPVFPLPQWGFLVLKPLTQESMLLHLLPFLKPVQAPVGKIENIAQQQVFPESQFCRTKPLERLSVLHAMEIFSIHSIRRLL